MNHLKRLHHYYTEFMNPSLDRSLSVHVITCNTVWQILKSRCPSILSTFAALGEVCSHEAKGGGGVTDTPQQHCYNHIGRLILTSKKGLLQ